MGNTITDIYLTTFEGVKKFKSIRRAIKRGNVTPLGVILPRRPFNNRSRLKGTRPFEVEKERIYDELKQR